MRVSQSNYSEKSVNISCNCGGAYLLQVISFLSKHTFNPDDSAGNVNTGLVLLGNA